MPAKPTIQRGAALERQAHLAHAKSVRRRLFKKGAADWVLDLIDKEFIQWTQKRTARYNKRPGVLQGRKRD